MRQAVTRYWDRITHPAQIISSLPQAVAAMLDPADCGPAFLALPQDTQELAFAAADPEEAARAVIFLVCGDAGLMTGAIVKHQC
jgi:TPP-dependent trihydroxycyclohexane-1,2-dione (THcHDO) dehydratase